MTSEIVIKCESVTEAQKAAKFINNWQKLIYASQCKNELAIKVRFATYRQYREGYPEDDQSSEQRVRT